MPQNPDQGSEPLAGDALMQADDATFARELGLDIGTEAAVTDAPAGQPRDEQGRFVAQEPEADPAPDPETEVAEAAATEAEPDAEPAPEGEPEAEPEAEAPPEPEKPPRSYVVRDATGQEVDAPDLRLTFKAGGKERTDVSLDQAIRWAQSGFHVQEVTQEAADLKRRLPEYEQRINDLTLRDSDQRALNERLLTDPDFYEAAREQYARNNTPEQVLARREAALREQQQAFEQQQLQTEANAFLANVTLPKIAELHQQYPTVTEQELAGILSIEVAPLQRNGRVPREQWSQISHLLDTKVRSYAEAQHAMRDAPRAKAEATAKTQVTKAREDATKAKRQLARAIAPGAAKTTPPKPRAINSAEDAAASVADEIVATILGT